MPALNILVERETKLGQDERHTSASTITLLTALVILLSVALALVGALFLLRRLRNKRKADNSLPSYESSGRGLSVTTIPYSEKEHLLSAASSSPTSPVPEIRITFPEEEDHNGRRVSGTVVLVQMGDTVGFRPVDNNGLPPSYSASAGGNGRFASVDLERVGGLREKI